MQREIVEAAREGDHEAFEVLAVSSADRFYALARLILRDVDLAQDAVQETLIRSWRGLPALRDPERFDARLHRLPSTAAPLWPGASAGPGVRLAGRRELGDLSRHLRCLSNLRICD